MVTMNGLTKLNRFHVNYQVKFVISEKMIIRFSESETISEENKQYCRVKWRGNLQLPEIMQRRTEDICDTSCQKRTPNQPAMKGKTGSIRNPRQLGPIFKIYSDKNLH
jgi:hypothetical protein